MRQLSADLRDATGSQDGWRAEGLVDGSRLYLPGWGTSEESSQESFAVFCGEAEWVQEAAKPAKLTLVNRRLGVWLMSQGTRKYMKKP